MRDPSQTLDLVIQRQIESTAAGNGAYLATFLRVVAAAGFHTRIVMAPLRSFGNRPWSYIHPVFADLVAEVVWSRTIAVGRWRFSTAPQVWWRFARRIGQAVLIRLGRGGVVFSHLASPLDDTERREVAALCNDRETDLTVAEYSALAPVLGDLQRASRTGVLMHDLLSERALEFRRMGLPVDFHEFSFDEEISWVSGADFSLFASKDEMQRSAARLPTTRCLWLRPETPAHGVRGGDAAARVVYLGTRHAGNVDALIHLLDDVWPKVVQQRSDAELLIVGDVSEAVGAERASAPGVNVLGRVDDLKAVGGPRSIGVAPTRLATGVSIKVAEYLMLGMPSVVYDKALQGFGDALDDLVEVVQDADGLAQAVVALIDDAATREQMSERGRTETAKRLRNDEVVDYLVALSRERDCAA